MSTIDAGRRPLSRLAGPHSPWILHFKEIGRQTRGGGEILELDPCGLTLGVHHGPAGQGQGRGGEIQADRPLCGAAPVLGGDGEAVGGPADLRIAMPLSSRICRAKNRDKGVAIKG